MATHLPIEANGLEKSYGTNHVLQGIDLSVARGTIFALLGPNGAGKTTTVRILATLLAPDKGRAHVAGFDVVSQQRDVRRRISITGQYAAVDELQTGAENLTMVGRLSGLSGAGALRRAQDLLAQFDLVEAGNRRVATYSGGMRRRLDLAAGLVGHPEVIFLDEPTTGLDPRGRQSMWEVIRGLVGSGVTIFLTTQYLEEADQLAGRIALVDGGRIVAEGTAAELKRHVPGARLDLTLADAWAYERVVRTLNSRAVQRDLGTLTVGIPTGGGAAEVRALLDEIDPDRTDVARFAVQSATLDDVYLELTGHAATTPNGEAANG